MQISGHNFGSRLQRIQYSWYSAAHSDSYVK